MLAHLPGIECEEVCIENHQLWEQTKDSYGLPFPSLPFYIDEENEVRLTGQLAILKYLAVKYQPAMLGRSEDDQGKIEMYAHTIDNFQKIATKPCYLEGADKQAIGDNCLKEVQAFVRVFEAQGASGKFLVGNSVSYPDFMLLELLERIQFLTDGRLYKEHAILQTYSQNVIALIESYYKTNELFQQRLFNASEALVNNGGMWGAKPV